MYIEEEGLLFSVMELCCEHVYRKQLLVTSTTELPYVLLSPAEINKQETSVRRGTLSVEKPQIIVPGHKQNIADFTVCALSFPYFILIFRNLTMSGLRIYVIL